MHQSTVVAVAQRSPKELRAPLHALLAVVLSCSARPQCSAADVTRPARTVTFFEGVCGTDHLREGVQSEAAKATSLQANLSEQEAALAAARVAEARHASSMLAFRRMEAARRRLEAMKSEQIIIEISFHTNALCQADRAAAKGRAAAAARKTDCDDRVRHLSSDR